MQDERKSIGDWKSVDDVIDSIRAGEFPGLAKDYDIEGGLARLVFDLWMRVDELERRVFELEGRN